MAIKRPTFHESWYRVSTMRPRLRSTVQTYRQHFRGREWHVVRDPSNNQHFRLDEAGYHFVALLDGRRTVEEAWQICNDHLGDDAPTQGEAINLLGQLYTSNLLQADLPPDAAGMFEIYRKRVKREIGGFFMNLLFMRIPLFDPDRILTRWAKVGGLAFTWYGFVIWLALLLLGLSFVIGRMGDLLSGISGVLDPSNLLLLYLSFAGVKAVHEFGHGFASKHFGLRNGTGGEVHTMGIMLLVFTPVPYVDASSSWAFRSSWQRAIVGAAGMYVELAIAAVAAIVWANTSPGLVNGVAYNIIFIASVSTLLFNGNPLLRFDGYYILSDLLEIPNLARRSRDYLLYLVRRYPFGVEQARSTVRSPGERFWFPVYGISSTIYRVFIFAGIILFVADKFFFIGAIFAIASIVSWLFIPLGRAVKYLATSPELIRDRPRAVTVSICFAAAVILLLGAIPFPDRARAEGVVEPRALALVYAEVDGFVGEVLPSGEMVAPGTGTLLAASNLELVTQRERLLAERRLTLIRRNAASLEEIALAQSLTDRVAAIDEQIDRAEQQLGALRITAPLAGRWIAPGADYLPGSFVKRGQQVGLVAGLDRLLVRSIADQGLGPRIEPEIGRGGTVQIRVKGRPDVKFEGTIEDILPAGLERLPSAALGYLGGGSTQVNMNEETGTQAVEPFFEVRIDLTASTLESADLWCGQRVVVRFELPARPLMVQWWRSLRQLVQRRFQI